MPKSVKERKRHEKPKPKVLRTRGSDKDDQRGEKKMAKGKSKKGRC